MDFKINTATVAVNEVVFSKSAEQSVDCDITLPDYCGDISRILKSFVRVNVTGYSLGEDRITVDGEVSVNLMYVSEGKLQCYEHNCPFNTNIDYSCDSVGAILSVTTAVQYVNCRAVNSRRFDVHGAFAVNVTLTSCKKEEVVDDADGCGIELLKDTVMACSSLGCASENCNINQVIDIGKEKPQIKSILRNTGTVVLLEKKQISGKVLVKGELRLTTLYISENDTVEREENVLPISQIVNLSELSEDSITDIDLNIISLCVNSKAGATGEVTLLDISAVISVGVSAYKCVEVPIVTDAYSTEYDCECEVKNVNIDRLIMNTDKNYTNTVEMEIGSSVTNVIDMWCDDVRCKAVAREGRLLYVGKYSIFALVKTDSDEIALKSCDVDFEFDSDSKSDIKNLKCTPKVKILSSDYTLGASALSVRTVFDVKANVFESENSLLIDNISVDENKPKPHESKMFIYYPDKNEKLWDIARHYNTTVKSVVQQNELSDEIISDGTPLLIWCK